MHFLVADTLLSVIAAKKGCLVHIALAWVGSKKDNYFESYVQSFPSFLQEAVFGRYKGLSYASCQRSSLVIV
jgi:hypothetical protein